MKDHTYRNQQSDATPNFGSVFMHLLPCVRVYVCIVLYTVYMDSGEHNKWQNGIFKVLFLGPVFIL
jgi:hypothetical protein